MSVNCSFWPRNSSTPENGELATDKMFHSLLMHVPFPCFGRIHASSIFQPPNFRLMEPCWVTVPGKNGKISCWSLVNSLLKSQEVDPTRSQISGLGRKYQQFTVNPHLGPHRSCLLWYFCWLNHVESSITGPKPTVAAPQAQDWIPLGHPDSVASPSVAITVWIWASRRCIVNDGDSTQLQRRGLYNSATVWRFNIAIENDWKWIKMAHVYMISLLTMVILHSYVKLPEDIFHLPENLGPWIQP